MLSEAEFPENFGHMKTRLQRACWLPGRIKPRFGRSLHAEKIHPPICLRAEVWRQSPHRQGNFRRPNLLLLVRMHPRLHSAERVSLVARRFVQINIQVDPHAIWTDLKLPVAMRPRWIRLEEDFRNVA